MPALGVVPLAATARLGVLRVGLGRRERRLASGVVAGGVHLCRCWKHKRLMGTEGEERNS